MVSPRRFPANGAECRSSDVGRRDRPSAGTLAGFTACWCLLFLGVDSGVDSLQAQHPGYAEGQKFLTEWTYSNAQRVRGERDDALLIGDEIAIEASLEWHVRQVKGATIVVSGEFLKGAFRWGRTALGRPTEELELPLQGVFVAVRIGRSKVSAEVESASWRRFAETIVARLKGGRIATREQKEILDRLQLELQGALVVPYGVSLQGDQRHIGFRLQHGLRSPDGTPAGRIYLDADNRAVEGSPDAKTLTVPLYGALRTNPKLLAGRLTTVRQPFRSRARLRPPETIDLGRAGYLLWQPDTDRTPQRWFELVTQVRYRDPDELGSVAEFLAPHYQEQAIEMGFWLRGRPAPLARRPGDERPPALDFRGVLGREFPALAAKLTALARRPGRVQTTIDKYVEMEERGEGAATSRALYHFALAEELAILAYRVGHAEVRRAVEALLERAKSPPALLLALRAVEHPYAILTDRERVERFLRVAGRDDETLALWGLRFLGAVPWEGVVEDLLRLRYEAAGKLSAARSAALEVELFRLLGPQNAPEGGMPVDWRDAKVPERAYDFAQIVRRMPQRDPGELLRSSVAQLGAQRLALVVTCDPELEKPLVPAPAAEGAAQVGVSVQMRQTSRLVWFREAAGEILADLSKPGQSEFGLAVVPRRTTRKSGKLVAATEENVAAAVAVLRGLKSDARARLSDALRAAVQWDLDAMLVLGGERLTPDVEVPLALWNYLRGVRVITVGFDSSAVATEPYLARLSRRHHGWHIDVRVR